MLVRRLDEILARTDPFDLAQAIERHTSTLSLRQIRSLISEARPRLGSYYVQEFSLVQAIDDPHAAQAAFAQALQSNLRAVPLFGRAFSQSILASAAVDRTVGIGEETSPGSGRRIAFAVVAGLLLFALGVGARLVFESRTQAALPAPIILTSAKPAPVAVRRTPARARRSTRPPPVSQTAAQTAAPAMTAPAFVRAAPLRALRRPPAGRGVATVVVPAPTLAPQAASMDTSDTPQSYTDATPMPEQTSAPLQEPRAVRVTTPTPQPRPGSWFHRAIMHIDPFKPKPTGTP